MQTAEGTAGSVKKVYSCKAIFPFICMIEQMGIINAIHEQQDLRSLLDLWVSAYIWLHLDCVESQDLGNPICSFPCCRSNRKEAHISGECEQLEDQDLGADSHKRENLRALGTSSLVLGIWLPGLRPYMASQMQHPGPDEQTILPVDMENLLFQTI